MRVTIVLCVLCAVLMIFGVAELLRVIVFWGLKPGNTKGFTVVVAPEGAEDCEAKVRAAAERIRWLDQKGSCRLICVNRKEDAEVERICLYLSLRYPWLKTAKPTELSELILQEETD